MKVIKILLGVLLLLISLFLGTGTLLTFLRSIFQTINEFNKDPYTGLGHALGSGVVLIVFGAIVYFLGKIGLRLLQNKPLRKRKHLEIDEIGK